MMPGFWITMPLFAARIAPIIKSMGSRLEARTSTSSMLVAAVAAEAKGGVSRWLQTVLSLFVT